MHFRLIVTDMRVFAGLSRTFYAQDDQACSGSFLYAAFSMNAPTISSTKTNIISMPTTMITDAFLLLRNRKSIYYMTPSTRHNNT